MSGRPKKYVDPIHVGIIDEKKEIEGLKLLGISPQDVWRVGKTMVLPQGISAKEWKIKQLEKEDVLLDKKFDEDNAALREKYEQDKEHIAKQLTLFREAEKDAEDTITKMWPLFLRQNQQIKGRPHWKGDDTEVHPWWELNGLLLTYGQVLKEGDVRGWNPA